MLKKWILFWLGMVWWHIRIMLALGRWRQAVFDYLMSWSPNRDTGHLYQNANTTNKMFLVLTITTEIKKISTSLKCQFGLIYIESFCGETGIYHSNQVVDIYSEMPVEIHCKLCKMRAWT